jgi:hypothetical protein
MLREYFTRDEFENGKVKFVWSTSTMGGKKLTGTCVGVKVCSISGGENEFKGRGYKKEMLGIFMENFVR